MKSAFLVLFFLVTSLANASFVLIPMEAEGQQNHLKAYGITYWALDKSYKVSWLLNYRGGSFLLPDAPEIRKECQIRGVTFEVLSDATANSILEDISSPSQNMETVVLEKAPKIAVYTPKGKQPWDVTNEPATGIVNVFVTPLQDIAKVVSPLVVVLYEKVCVSLVTPVRVLITFPFTEYVTFETELVLLYTI